MPGTCRTGIYHSQRPRLPRLIDDPHEVDTRDERQCFNHAVDATDRHAILAWVALGGAGKRAAANKNDMGGRVMEVEISTHLAS